MEVFPALSQRCRSPGVFGSTSCDLGSPHFSITASRAAVVFWWELDESPPAEALLKPSLPQKLSCSPWLRPVLSRMGCHTQAAGLNSRSCFFTVLEMEIQIQGQGAGRAGCPRASPRGGWLPPPASSHGLLCGCTLGFLPLLNRVPVLLD